MRVSRFALALALVSCTWPSAVTADAEMGTASAPLNYYAPVPSYHDRIYRKIGVLLTYIVGPQYTQAVIDDVRGREWQLVVSGNFTIEGRSLRCQQAPSHGDTNPDIFCPDWPSDIDPYATPVVFQYWITRLGDNTIAVLQSIDPAKR